MISIQVLTLNAIVAARHCALSEGDELSSIPTTVYISSHYIGSQTAFQRVSSLHTASRSYKSIEIANGNKGRTQ